MDHVEVSKSSALLLSVDYKKAFDTVRWDLIFQALTLFSFGDYIINAIKIMFLDVKSAVCNAGYSSAFFVPERGICQGCCASPSLFTITVELLAILVRKATHIRGIQVGDSEFKISQYADDSTLFIRDYHTLSALINLLNNFTRFSGLAINPSKYHLLPLGCHPCPPKIFKGFKRVEQIKIFSLTFKRNITDQEQLALNFEPQLQRTRLICNSWANRQVSLMGKVTLIKSLMASLLQYPIACTNSQAQSLHYLRRWWWTFYGRAGRVR